MRIGLPLALAAAAFAQSPPDLAGILSRVSEEAEVFIRMADKTLAEESLEQRAVKAPPRFRPRIGKSALEPPKPRVQTRQIVSEYSYARFDEAGGILHELRQVVSVDGRRVATPEKARRTLFLGVQSKDDRLKKKMLEDFEKHGLVGAVTDFGPLLLLFRRQRLALYQYEFGGEARLGPDTALILKYRQTSGQQPLTVFRGRQALRQNVSGEIWVRKSDLLPLRITMTADTQQDKQGIRHEAAVEYVFSSHGFLTPASVVYRELVDNQLTVENLFRYTPFRKFSAEAEIKFDVIHEAEKK